MVKKRWIEVDDQCFGPDRQESGGWYLWLLICFCKRIARKDGTTFDQRRRGVKVIEARTKKAALKNLEEFMEQSDVVLLANED